MNPAGVLYRRITHRLARLRKATELAVSADYVVSGYLGLSRVPGVAHSLEGRIPLLAAQLAAELGGCPWCIERCRHDCRKAGIASEPVLTPREHAALAFVEAIVHCQTCGRPDERILGEARGFFADSELAELAALVAEYHCLESQTFNLAPP